MLEPRKYPWNVPVPVRPSSFVPLFKRDWRFNVQVQLGRIGAFRATTRPLGDVLYADLQDNPDGSLAGRLGSGRAGIYCGRYLKGVGRTSLAANWNEASDLAHNSGHLPASSGIREYLVSVYLEAKRAAHIVNPTRGILVKPSTKSLRPMFAAQLRALRASRDSESDVWRADCALQTLTVKDANFARYSNFVWLLNHLEFSPQSMVRFDEFFVLLLDRLEPWKVGSKSVPEPSMVVDALDATIERAFDYFYTAWRLGISWGTMQNNFSIDGRVLDLESPVILGAPLVGVIGDSPSDTCFAPSRMSGSGLFDVVSYVRHARAAHKYLHRRMAMILESPELRTGPRPEYVCAVVAEMSRRNRAGNSLFSARAVANRLMRWVNDHGTVAPAHRRSVAKMIRKTCAAYLIHEPPQYAELRLRPVRVQLARLGPTRRLEVHVLEGVDEPRFEEGTFVNELIDKLDRVSDVDRLLNGLHAAAAAIRRYCGTDGSDRRRLSTRSAKTASE
jgi:hypothetical protein